MSASLPHRFAGRRPVGTALATFAADLSVMVAAFLAAHALRFNFQPPAYGWEPVTVYWIPVIVLEVAALYAFRCHRIVWRFFGAYDVPRLVAAAGSSTFVLVMIWLFTRGGKFIWWRPPLSVSILNGVFFLGGAVLVRMLWRLVSEGRNAQEGEAKAPYEADAPVRRVLIVGAGTTGNAVAHEFRQNRAHGVEVVGFLDDDPARLNAILQGVRVVGPVSALRDAIRRFGANEVFVTLAPIRREVIRAIVHDCEDLRVPVRISPGIFEMLGGAPDPSLLREVDVADLLGRDEIDLASDAELARFVAGTCVMVTGAGGSIGSELARQVMRLGPSRLVLFERSEPALHEIHRALRRRAAQARVEVVPVAGDIADRARVAEALARFRPGFVLNAAAHKHVPLMECNVTEAIRNNVLATRVLGEEAVKAGVKVFVQLSTDKAVKPSSVMGASKRLAEFAIQDLNREGSTRFAAVRFGNVLGASGSVVPLFREQIRAGGPVTVTHPDMQRYFMTIPEACRLVLEAASIAAGGEIFILDMGEPIRIVELATEMIRLSGLRPYEDIPIVFTGLRPGEKLFEELSTREEHADRTRLPRVFIGRIAAPAPEAVAEMLACCGELCGRAAPDDETRRAIARFVPENTFGNAAAAAPADPGPPA
ncbi:MAG: polysaccharide biosynthesis protein [Kiritimatiellia bacterium]|jgi:FlaA1/EpsC-like NDP-sugar epimerase